MKAKFNLVSIGSLILFLTVPLACFKEADAPLEEISRGKTDCSFVFTSISEIVDTTAVADTAAVADTTKVGLAADNTLFWTAGDKMAAYAYKADALYQKDVATLSAGEGTGTGTFVPETYTSNTDWYDDSDATTGYTFYAWYPASEAATPDDSKVITVTNVSSTQEEARGIAPYLVCWATTNTTKATLASGTAPSFAFTPKSALLKLAIQNNTAQTTNITRIIITATGGNIAGDASLVLADGTLSAGDSNVITCILASPIRIAPNSTLAVPVYVSVLPCAATNLAIVCAEDEGVYGSVNIAMSSIDSGKVYSKTAVLSSFQSQRFVIANPGDQSAKSDVLEANNLYYGTANCVLVPKTNASFDVNIQLFKTNDGYSRSASSASPFTSAVTSAKIIWTESGLSTDANFRIAAGDLSKITLSKTSGTTGNALLGIYDADGSILWSYHIWVPNDASVNTPGGSHSGRYTEAFNLALGQLETPNEPYMYYQWGRKDPLGRANEIASSTGLKGTSGDGPSTSKFISALATGHSGNNLAYARQNPMVYITQNDDKLYDWYPTTSGTVRTDGNKPACQNDNLWKDTTVGTIYDPCPEGYHVPGNNSLWHDAEGKTYSSETKSWTILNFQYVLGGLRHRVDSGVNGVAGRGGFWSSEAVGGSYPSSRNLDCNDAVVYPTGNYGRANGVGVRCVKGGGDSFESNSFAVANPTDQSARSAVLEDNNLYYGTANCVLVDKDDASINVNIQLFKTNDGYSRSDESAGPFTSAVTSAKIIWVEGSLSNDPAFKITAGDLSKITLSKTSGTTGNALLGIYDADGRVLWSYHIWVPNDASEVEPEQGLNASDQQYSITLKLALGQIANAQDTYMFYQWGRKDPLGRAASPVTLASNTLITCSGDGPTVDKEINATATGHSGNNLAYARQNPTVFITRAGEESYDWYPTQDVNDASHRNDNLWGASATIYDPCPYGYHVPDNNKLWEVNNGTKYEVGATVSGVDFTHYDTDKYFNILGLDYVRGGGRYSGGTSVDDVAGNGYYWSFGVDGGRHGRRLRFDSSMVDPMSNSGRASAFGVRCVKGGPISSYESKVIENSTDQTAKSAVLEGNNLYYGTANCVLVDKEDTSIDVNIQLFKTSDGYSRSAASASPFTSAVTFAKIIWAESGLSTDANFKITSADLSNITISKTAGSTGNALLGIYDSDGRILWSYHIWAPADASEVTPAQGANASGQQYSKALKLALGQIANAQDTYMYYQWGRKDPLGRAASPVTLASNTLIACSGDGPTVDKKINATATGHSGNNLAYARQNPTVFITRAGNESFDWYPTRDVNDASHRNDNLWGASATIYDPCPYGYHVPDNNKLWKVNDGTGYSVGDTVSGVDFTQYDTDKYVNILGLDYVRGGFRDRDDARVIGVADRGYCWSFGVNGRYSRGLRFNSSSVSSYDDSRVYGFGVRCVKN